jgi:hypothetical protein
LLQCLNWFKDEDLQTNLIISEAEFNELFKAAGISAEQFDLGDY